MTVQQFKIWLIQNGYSQKSLAERLDITERTISVYNRNGGRYPTIFLLALKGLENAKNV